MTDAPQFPPSTGSFVGFARWPRRFAVEDTKCWTAVSFTVVRKMLRDHGYRLQPMPDGVQRSHLVLIDSFDWRLAESGSVLIGTESGERFLLPLDEPGEPDDPAVLLSRIEDPLLLSQIDTIRLPETLSERVWPRVLLRLGEGDCEERLLSLIDENGKTVALLQGVTLSGPPGGATRTPRFEAFRIVPLRGFFRAVPTVPGPVIDIGVEIASFLARPRGRRPFDYQTGLQLPLQKTDTMDEVNRIVVHHLVAVCSLNVEGIVRRIDPEFLHDFRVSLRRLRSYLKAIPHRVPPGVSGELRAFWTASGLARDLDVFLLREDHYAHAAPVAIRGEVQEVFVQLTGWRERAYDTLITSLRSDAFLQLRAGFLLIKPKNPGVSAKDLAAELHANASRAFSRSVDRLIRSYAVHGEAISDDRIHDTRIKAKKLRYITEIFAPLLGSTRRSEGRTIKRMRKLQNLLGAYNDLVVEENLFLGILDERPGELERLRAGVAYMLAQVEREKAATRHMAMEVLRRELS